MSKQFQSTKVILNIFLGTLLVFIIYTGYTVWTIQQIQSNLLTERQLIKPKIKKKKKKKQDIIYTIINNSKYYTIAQKQIILRSYEVGKPYDIGYTLAAISVKESTAGKYQINFNDPSCGIYHNLLSSVLSRLGYKDNYMNRSMICTQLIYDTAFAEQQAIEELLFWKRKYEGQPLAWQHMIQSYNAGYNHNNGHSYFIKVNKLVKYFKGE